MFSQMSKAKVQAYLLDHRYDTASVYRVGRQNDSYRYGCFISVFIGSGWLPE